MTVAKNSKSSAKVAPTTTKFPTMGKEAARLSRVAQPERGRSVKKSGNAKGGMVEPATAAVRGAVHERLGFMGHPVPRTSFITVPEAADTQRNTIFLNSAVGNRDFYLRRQYGQGM